MRVPFRSRMTRSGRADAHILACSDACARYWLVASGASGDFDARSTRGRSLKVGYLASLYGSKGAFNVPVGLKGEKHGIVGLNVGPAIAGFGKLGLMSGGGGTNGRALAAGFIGFHQGAPFRDASVSGLGGSNDAGGGGGKGRNGGTGGPVNNDVPAIPGFPLSMGPICMFEDAAGRPGPCAGLPPLLACFARRGGLPRPRVSGADVEAFSTPLSRFMFGLDLPRPRYGLPLVPRVVPFPLFREFFSRPRGPVYDAMALPRPECTGSIPSSRRRSDPSRTLVEGIEFEDIERETNGKNYRGGQQWIQQLSHGMLYTNLGR